MGVLPIAAGDVRHRAVQLFNIVSSEPLTLGFSVSEPLIPGKDVKDTLAFKRVSRQFVVNIPTAQHFGRTTWVMGTVVHAHFRDGLVGDGYRTDPTRLRPLGRMPGKTFCTKTNVVPRAAVLAVPNAGLRSSVLWVGNSSDEVTPRPPGSSARSHVLQ
jgi:flavin reductase (DIM6/NTAB) family NADH-FMN oxidoreductase RutF